MLLPFYHLVGGVVSNLLILVGLTYLLSLLIAAQSQIRTAYYGAVFGLALGVVCGVVMFTSTEVRTNSFLDLRLVVVLISGLLGGPVSAVVTAAISIMFRAVLAGGIIVVPAIMSVLAAIIGVTARMLGVKSTLRALLALGLGIGVLRSSAGMVTYLLAYTDLASAQNSLTTLLPILLVFCPLGTMAMGGLLRFERQRLDEKADLKSVNKVLAERDERFQTVFDLSNAAMLWTAKDSSIVRANQRMADLVGYTVEELQSMNYEALIPLEDRQEYYRVRDERLATGVSPKDLQRRYLRKDGGIFWGLRSVTRVQSGPDGPAYRFVMIQDITERKEAEDKIRFQAELLESVEQAVIATDLAGTVIFWNGFAETLFALPAADVLGHEIAAVLPAIKSHIDRSAIDAPASDRDKRAECSLHRPDGSSVVTDIVTSPVKARDGSLIGVVAVMTDVTEERNAQHALLEERRVLAVLNRTAAKLNTESSLTALLQSVTDAGVELTGAEFGAIFSGRISAENDHFQLYALSGIDLESFDALPLPREDGVVGPVLHDQKLFRWDDVSKDPAYADALASRPLPAGASQVRSWLAVPLVARSGRVIGALFLGHSQAGIFTARTEQIMQGIGSHAAIAIEKATLFQAAQQEIETRKKIEESLNKSEARFRDFAEVGSDLLWETDEQFRVTSIVGDSRSVFGLAEEELIGKTAWEFAKADLSAPDWRQHLLDHETRQPFRNFEYQVVDKNGAMRWISANGRPYYDAKENLLGFRGSSTNIAARKHAEAKLAASARQQQSAAVLSQLALQGVPRDDLYQVAVELVARTLGVELVGILELSVDKRVLRLRAGSGWPSQSVNIRAVPLDYCPPLARGISSDVPVHFSRRIP